jgi:hypothetical protein
MRKLKTRESKEHDHWWFLVFSDNGRPLGSSVVQGKNFLGAVKESWRLGVNPGGQCVGDRIPNDEYVPDEAKNRLFTDKETRAYFVRKPD